MAISSESKFRESVSFVSFGEEEKGEEKEGEEEEEEEEKGRKRWISIVINGHDYLAKLAPLYANQPCRHPRPAHNTRASILLLHLYEPF